MRRLVVLVAGAVTAMALVHVAAPPPAGACSCTGLDDQQALAQADVAVVGEVVARDEPAAPGSSLDPALWTFRVRTVFKGEVATRQGVASAMSGASCGLELPTDGSPVLVFARREPHPMEVELDGATLYGGLCEGSRALAGEPVDPAFGPGRAPAEGSSGIVSADGDALRRAVAAVVAGMAVVGVAVAQAVVMRNQ